MEEDQREAAELAAQVLLLREQDKHRGRGRGMTPPLQKLQGSRPGGSGQIQRAKTKNRTVPFKTKTPSTKRKGRKERQKQRVKTHKTHNPMNIYKSASNSTLHCNDYDNILNLSGIALSTDELS